MKKGWIIVNHFLNSNKFRELYDFFRNAAAKLDIKLTLYTNAEATTVKEKPDFVIFWDKDIRLARTLEAKGLRLFNKADAIADCDDKYSTYLKLSGQSVQTPFTLSVPMTYQNIGYTDFSFLDEYAEIFSFPYVLKENFGSFGEQVYLVHSTGEAKKIISASDGRPMIAQKYISSSFGKDIRINIVGDKVVAAMERYSINGDFRANLSIGGKMRKIIPESSAIQLALAASKALNLDFCGVDLLYNKNGEYTVCEVNSNAHFKNIYDLTGVDFAKEIIKYIGETI